MKVSAKHFEHTRMASVIALYLLHTIRVLRVAAVSPSYLMATLL